MGLGNTRFFFTNLIYLRVDSDLVELRSKIKKETEIEKERE